MFCKVLLMGALCIAGAEQAQAAAPQAWVEMAPGGGSVVRVLTLDGACPALEVDGTVTAMTQRAAPAALPPRANKAGVAAGVTFASRVCEWTLPRSAQHANLAGQTLPLPRPRIDRIVLIGDTGCRLKDADKAWQGCNDPAAWPFAAIAARAAALRPDLVLHVGDYLYRENPCPAGQQNCANTAWGYGEDGWQADFLAPAAPLLAAAPWAMVRGNHEECARAGQGWWRLLDPHGRGAGRDCIDPAQDAAGDHTDPYAVDLGGGTQLVVADFMEMASGKAKDPAVASTVASDMAQIASLTSGAKDSFVTAHYPLNAVLWDKDTPGAVTIGSKPVSAFPFAERPTQVITGFSGTMEDAALAPTTMAEAQGKTGAAAITALTTIANQFGYALLERHGDGWDLTAYALDGHVLGHFQL